jgi:type I protein arginine methyltransferase
MYSVDSYGRMIRDAGRTNGYARALQAAVKSDSVVLDIGTGPGILALLACRYGARKVYAVESSDVIQLAQEAAAANGFADKIEFIQGISTRIDLPEKVQVIVSEIHGVLPPFASSLRSITDARDRFLAAGGILIPRRETLWVALASAPDDYDAVVGAWETNGYGFDFQSVREKALNNWRRASFNCEHLISEPRCWATLDYQTLSIPNVCGQAECTADRGATAHGLAVWFDWEAGEGIRFSNSPASPTKHIFAQGFFPWPKPVQLSQGHQVSIQIRADLVGDDYVWSWDTNIGSGDDPSRAPVKFRQSTFHGLPLSATQIRKRAQEFVPTLSEEGYIDGTILEQMAQRLPLDQIARNLAAQYPRRFLILQEALNRVADLAVKYSL